MQNKPRAYISCPLEAALAAKNFGFEYDHDDYGRISPDDFFHELPELSSIHLDGNFYIAPESLPLLYPLVGDLVWHDEYFIWKREQTKQYIDAHFFGLDTDGNRLSPFCGTSRIIQRNNKPFPAIQYEDVE
jgi:hypothetical protein